LVADGIDEPTLVADLRVTGGTATPGQPSYGAFIRNSTSALVLDTLVITGGTGGTGANGAAGTTPGGTAAAGSGGADGFEPGGVCNTTASGQGGNGAGGGGRGG